MPDRSIAPEFNLIEQIKIQQAVPHLLENGVKLYSISAGSQDIIKIEFLFEAGSIKQSGPLIASSVNCLITEGTENKSASEIAEFIDFYGAFLQTESGKDFASVILYTLSKHLENLLPTIKEIITEASFSENEVNIYSQNALQKFKVENQKVSHLARRHFMNMLFGNENFYGYLLKEEDYENIRNPEVLKNFFRNNYSEDHCTIIVSGKVTDEVIDQISDLFGKKWRRSDKNANSEFKLFPPSEKQRIVEKEDSIQSAIRIGRMLFNKEHPDYLGMQVLNTVLGGYFGSRLMANIREDKGYTYGIGSGIASLKKAGYFFISTEVGVDVCQKAINEIYFEIGRLRNKLISENELNLVRNYMLGVFLKNVDGPFELSDRFKAIYEYGLGYEYYDRYFETIQKITPQRLRDLANKYLQEEDLLELVAGKK